MKKIKTKIRSIYVIGFILIFVITMLIAIWLRAVDESKGRKLMSSELIQQSDLLINESADYFFELLDREITRSESISDLLLFIKEIDALNHSVIVYDFQGNQYLEEHTAEVIENLFSINNISSQVNAFRENNKKTFDMDNYAEFIKSDFVILPVKVRSRIYNQLKLIIGYGKVMDNIKGSFDHMREIDMKNLQSTLAVNAIFILVVMIVIFLISNFYIDKKISNPINMISTILEQISSGQWDLTRKLQVKSKDEIGKLSEHYNHFILTLNQLVSRLKATVGTAREIDADLHNISAENSNNTRQIAASIDTTRDAVNQLNSEMQKTTMSVSRIREAIKNVAILIENQSNSVIECSSSIEEIAGSISNLSGIMDKKQILSKELHRTATEGLTQMDQSTGQINKISLFSREMMEIIALINSVSDQIDLLSMNAAIEAAHAGEAGKGFAVVADEIRILSDQTKSNASLITEKLKNTIEDILVADEMNKAAGSIFVNLVSGIQEITDAMDETSHGMKELLLSSRSIVQALGLLMNNSGEIQEKARVIDTDVQGIDEIINQTAESSREIQEQMVRITGDTAWITQSMETLTEIGKKNASTITDLTREVDQFKI